MDENCLLIPPMPMFGERSPKWPAARKHHLERFPKCCICEATEQLDVHHVEPYHKAPMMELLETNLITLCRVHHFWFGHLGSWHSFNPKIVSDAEQWHAKICGRP